MAGLTKLYLWCNVYDVCASLLKKGFKVHVCSCRNGDSVFCYRVPGSLGEDEAEDGTANKKRGAPKLAPAQVRRSLFTTILY